MRTIKFRAKNLDGEWVYGFYVEEERQTLNGFEKKHFIVNDGYDYVNPATVGQFTGLYDKNGMRIFEGDIVDAWSAGEHLPNGIIKWGESIAGFFIMPPKCNAVWHLVGNDQNKETLEVVGNIHDNPELLKGNNV